MAYSVGSILRFFFTRGTYLGREHSGSLSLFRFLYCLLVLLEIVGSIDHRDGSYDKRDYHPIQLLAEFSVEPMPLLAFQVIRGVLLFALVLAAIGVATRSALVVSLIAFVLYEGTHLGFTKPRDSDYVYHMSNLTVFALALLAAAPGVGRHGVASYIRGQRGEAWIPEWPRRTLIGLIAIAYFGAGYCKMVESPLWVDGDTLQGYLLGRAVRFDMDLPIAIANHHTLCVVLSVMTIVFELTFPLIFFFPRLAWLYVPGGILFHLMILLTMKINFFDFFASNYLVFIDWTWIKRLRDRTWKPPVQLANLPVRPREAALGFLLLASLSVSVFAHIECWPFSDFRVYSSRRTPDDARTALLGRPTNEGTTYLPDHIQRRFQRAVNGSLLDEVAESLKLSPEEREEENSNLRSSLARIVAGIDEKLLHRKRALHLYLKKPEWNESEGRFVVVMHDVMNLQQPD